MAKLIQISTADGGHQWDKLNLVTLSDRKGGYDQMRCTGCGLKGRRYTLSTIHVLGSVKKIMSCPGAKPEKNKETRSVKVINCNGMGKAFDNLTPGSEHEIVTPAKWQNDKRGEWVMGVGEPVLLLYSEFIYVAQ